jgi:inosine/xanthosine triphosphatase
MKVCLASSSALKVSACVKAFSHCFCDVIVEVDGVDGIESGISSQPWGNDETLLGAQNRLDALLKKKIEADYFCSVENGISLIGSQYVDFAFVIVRHVSGAQAIVPSVAIPIPNHLITELEKVRQQGQTIGDVAVKWFFENEGIKVDSKDPHSTLCSGFITREDCLFQAFCVAIGIVIRATRSKI